MDHTPEKDQDKIRITLSLLYSSALITLNNTVTTKLLLQCNAKREQDLLSFMSFGKL